MSIKHLLLLIFFVVSACTSGSSSDATPAPPPDDQQKTGTGEPAQGYINGQAWIFRSGRAFYKKSQKNFLVVQLWGEEFANPCKEKLGSVLQMRLTAPSREASWTITPEDPFNANLSIFFSDLDYQLQPKDNMRADRGEITFHSIDREHVTGTVFGSFQNPRVGGTRVGGDFSVPFCP